MERWEFLVIGGGASGLMAAGCCREAMKRRGKVPLVLEGNDKLGKKLLATGNGRCNLSNLEIVPWRYHGDKLAAKVLERYPAQRVLKRFRELGLLCRADGEGRVYPSGNQAAAVLQALRRDLGECCQEAPVVSVVPGRGARHDEFEATAADGKVYRAGKVLLACGGMASPAHSRGGAGYELARSLGHSVTELTPSLVPLKSSSKVCRALKGMRAKARATLYRWGEPVYGESGEVIFGDGQLSGICVFNLSSRLRETGLRGMEVGLDLLEDMDGETLLDYLKSLRADHGRWRAGELFSGALNLRVGQELLKAAGLPCGSELRGLTDEELIRAAKLAKDWRFPITGTGGWADAQVTAGGVPLTEVDLDTMESKLCPGLYLAGELLDVDGDCGGYNLHWAWATGMIAGEAAAKSLLLKDRGGKEI